jgi:hypothetical protein
MVQLSATRYSCIAILWVSLVSFATITPCVASQWVFLLLFILLSTQSGTFGYSLVCIHFIHSVWRMHNNLTLPCCKIQIQTAFKKVFLTEKQINNLSKPHHVWREDSLAVLSVDVFHVCSLQYIHSLWCETRFAKLTVRWHTTAATKLSCTCGREHHDILLCYLHNFFITWSDRGTQKYVYQITIKYGF